MSASPESRAAARKIVAEALAAGDTYRWNEDLYRRAGRDAGTIPWAELAPNPHLVSWLAGRPAGVGKTAIVIGCGLGDDAEALAAGGYRVIAFDVSEAAVAWCRERFAGSPVRYWTADLFAPPTGLGWADLVVEAYTLQTLPADVRVRAMEAIAKLVAPGGMLLVVARGREPSEPRGEFPWPLTRGELATFSHHGLEEVRFEDFLDDETPRVRRFRAEYRNPVDEALKTHDVVLRGTRVALRPLTEGDWPLIVGLWNEPEVAAWAGGAADGQPDAPGKIQAIYRRISRGALQFVVEREGEAIGDIHLQRMNLPRLLDRHPGTDMRRIDLALRGDAVWGRGLGSEAIRLLTRFGFERERADMVFGCSISYDNPRSFLAFAKAGYELPDGTDWVRESREGNELDLVSRREAWQAFHAGDRPLVIRKAVADDHAAALDVQVEAAKWLLARGIRQWEAYLTKPELFSALTAKWIAAEELWLAELEGSAAGVVRVAPADDEARALWPDASPAQRYVSKLAIRRAFAGRGLGLRLLRRAELIGLAAGATAIRLDCVADSPELPAYYARAGYQPRGEGAAFGFRLARFERNLAG